MNYKFKEKVMITARQSQKKEVEINEKPKTKSTANGCDTRMKRVQGVCIGRSLAQRQQWRIEFSESTWPRVSMNQLLLGSLFLSFWHFS